MQSPLQRSAQTKCAGLEAGETPTMMFGLRREAVSDLPRTSAGGRHPCLVSAPAVIDRLITTRDPKLTLDYRENGKELLAEGRYGQARHCRSPVPQVHCGPLSLTVFSSPGECHRSHDRSRSNDFSSRSRISRALTPSTVIEPYEGATEVKAERVNDTSY